MPTFTYDPTPVALAIPEGYPLPTIPADNPTTEQGVLLGRMLFYDPVLSSDSSMACASCHLQEKAFAEPLKVSKGVLGLEGRRNSMNLFNLAYTNFLTWDGEASSLEEQALEPVQNELELNLEWEQAVIRMQLHEDYPRLFHEAFGPNEEISSGTATKAIAQFLRTMISFSSKYDMVLQGGLGVQFTEQEFDGLDLFENENGIPGEAECVHCHGGLLFTDNDFHNNGLSDVSSANDFVDRGLGETTNSITDYGLFKSPTLRNIELTAPYMHDGRFETLEEVIDHYSSGVHNSPTLDPLIASPFTNGVTLNFTDKEKSDLVAFLKTLTDTVFINNENFSSPFE